MGRITEQMLRSRAEHNEGMITTLEEIALHQQNIEKIELLGHYCRGLKIVYMQNNLIPKIQNLHRLKALQYLNIAINNITRIQNLQRCESLEKLDLTINFIEKAGLLSIPSLNHNVHLRELTLMGNPCCDWSGYRQYVVAKLPHLRKLDGKDIRPSERIEAQQALPEIEARLHKELIAEGVDPVEAATVEDDSEIPEEVEETGYLDEETGEMKRPWCKETRILEHREMEAQQKREEEKKSENMNKLFAEGGGSRVKRHEDFDTIEPGARIFQKNEGKWEFEFDDDGKSITLDVQIGKFLDTSLIKTDLQPTYVRLLIKGKLLQLELPEEVRPDDSVAQRSKATGALLLTMPKEKPSMGTWAGTNPAAAITKQAALNPKKAAKAPGSMGGALTSIHNIVKNPGAEELIKEVKKANLQEAESDDDEPPPL